MKRREAITPDLTPLIDVVFILLIFFIVSTVFKKEELALMLSLPASSAKEAKIELKQINIELSPDKLAYLGKEITFNKLDDKLSKIKKKEKPVIVRIDKTVAYSRVIKILDLLQKYSLNNLALITKEDKK
ncbi:MAG: biopolymer transporter ExbD [Campylobacteraceae bacterium]|jgi:biopolymer transport protein ExbD|nr:biopolymer transporter ExbD [Campylobacteraceae bacterium]MBT4030871.1 biopolymer transporter ExbD [Campylobacteraceae bacterium]MBT4179497.1 biopolymer transporter ExbD [Campylobacteraceae bacterium]MBT4572307.1 biopolymer transporter ExbD [Campylobacteraceae bacterium]MBT4707392.1 biopolymer transporter ExbD [Campylobacteraceae bacterium]